MSELLYKLQTHAALGPSSPGFHLSDDDVRQIGLALAENARLLVEIERLQTGWELATKAVDENTSLKAGIERLQEGRTSLRVLLDQLVIEVANLRAELREAGLLR